MNPHPTLPSCNSRIGLVVGAVIGEGVEVFWVQAQGGLVAAADAWVVGDLLRKQDRRTARDGKPREARAAGGQKVNRFGGDQHLPDLRKHLRFGGCHVAATFPFANPIKIAACRQVERAARVRRLEAYPWSSYPGYVDAGKRLEFVCYDLLADYGRTLAEARRQYRAYVQACVLEDDGPLIEALAASRYAIGGSGFVEETERRLAQRRCAGSGSRFAAGRCSPRAN